MTKSKRNMRLQLKLTKTQECLLKELKESAKNLESKATEESHKLDCLEQYDRRQNLEFEGIPHRRNENVNDIINNQNKQSKWSKNKTRRYIYSPQASSKGEA